MNILAGVVIALSVAPCAGLSAQELSDVSAPGAEHAELGRLVGDWAVSVAERPGPIGTAAVRMRLEGRFLEIEAHLDAGPVSHVIYTVGFDRRHDAYTVTVMDDTGTYPVHARGTRDGGIIKMYGVDDDPGMARMGLTKEFVIVLEMTDVDHLAVETRFIDTRTEARTEMSFLRYALTRVRTP